MTDETRNLQVVVRDFFEKYLTTERYASVNTIASYRDAIKLFIVYSAEERRCKADRLDYSVLDVANVRGFLKWLETERNCGARTRNQRLAVLKSFAVYVATIEPRHLERCRTIRELPRAGFERPEPPWLDEEDTLQLMKAVQGTDSRRDSAFLMLLYDTGARVQEVADLNVRDVNHDGVPFVRLQGKGRKQRTNVVGAATLKALLRWLEVRRNPGPDEPLFVNTRGSRITRSGIAWVLGRAAQRAGLKPNNAAYVTPHVIRHTTAMHLLRSGVDITTVAAWLGHASLETTNDYVQITLRMKQEALAQANPPSALEAVDYPSDELIVWLDNLVRVPRYVERSARNLSQ